MISNQCAQTSAHKRPAAAQYDCVTLWGGTRHLKCDHFIRPTWTLFAVITLLGIHLSVYKQLCTKQGFSFFCLTTQLPCSLGLSEHVYTNISLLGFKYRQQYPSWNTTKTISGADENCKKQAQVSAYSNNRHVSIIRLSQNCHQFR